MNVKEAKKQISKDLAKIAFWFETTLGFPHEVFEDEMKEKLPTFEHARQFIIAFKEEHPNIL